MRPVTASELEAALSQSAKSLEKRLGQRIERSELTITSAIAAALEQFVPKPEFNKLTERVDRIEHVVFS